jgi:hypothetical protein
MRNPPAAVNLLVTGVYVAGITGVSLINSEQPAT